MAPYIATFPEYNICLREHLLHVKLRHWDRGLRELAASAAARLVPTAPEYFSSTALDETLAWCLNSNLQVITQYKSLCKSMFLQQLLCTGGALSLSAWRFERCSPSTSCLCMLMNMAMIAQWMKACNGIVTIQPWRCEIIFCGML